MIGHVSLEVADLARARAFYDAVLAPLGYRRLFDLDDASGYGAERKAGQALPFWLGRARRAPAANGHLCFAAPSRAAIDAFHRAALAAGGADNGKPGLRPHYHANYYAAFAIDLDGNRIEAARHEAE